MLDLCLKAAKFVSRSGVAIKRLLLGWVTVCERI